jgi:hypothetical protein
MKVLLEVVLEWSRKIMWVVAAGSLANAGLAIFKAYMRSLGI